MKKILAVALSVVALAGCTPSEEQVKQTATAIGYAAGVIANETPIKDEARTAVTQILNEVRTCIPAEGQSFADAWAPVIKERVAELVAAGKLDAPTGEIVVSAAMLAAKGVDYLFDVRFPKAKEYANLVSAGASGAIDGFLAAFPPPDAKNGKLEYDKKAYKWLKENR